MRRNYNHSRARAPRRAHLPLGIGTGDRQEKDVSLLTSTKPNLPSALSQQETTGARPAGDVRPSWFKAAFTKSVS